MPKYYEDADILAVDSGVMQDCPFGTNIDDLAIIDLDGDGFIAAIEVLYPKRRWRVHSDGMRWRATTSPSDIELVNRASSVVIDNVPFRVETNENRSIVLVQFGSNEASAKYVELGADCLAIIRDKMLAGFLLRIS